MEMIAELEALKHLLRHEWDPIGVAGSAGAEDEYDSYAFEIFVMLSAGAGEAEIAAYLDRIESEHMGLDLRADRNRAVAAGAAALHTSRKSHPGGSRDP